MKNILTVICICAVAALCASCQAQNSSNPKATKGQAVQNGNKIASEEQLAQNRLRQIVLAQANYFSHNKKYANSLSALAKDGLLTNKEFLECDAPGKDSKPINGYIFQMTAGKPWTNDTFFVRCRPASPKGGNRCFSVDVSGNVVPVVNY